MRHSVLLIHLDNFRHNLGVIRKLVGPRVKISVSMKADAYGHGALDIARAAERGGADFLGVATPQEGMELRRAGVVMPILLYGLCLPEEHKLLVQHDISAVAVDDPGIEAFEGAAEKLGRPALLHLKIDTGMGRIGCAPEDAVRLAARIASSPFLRLEGVATHFPCSDEKDLGFTRQQIALFRDLANRIKAAGVNPGLLHASNSGGVLQCPEANFSMVRPGILPFGYYPSREVARPLDIRPVMELRSRVLFLKKVPAGTPISYGCTYRTPAPTWIATLGVGYADGYPRSLSNRGRVLIKGRTYPVVGRVTMDQVMVDLGPQTEIRRYDEAVMFGPDPAGPGAEDLAELAGTIPYEITCGINRRVPRLVVGAETDGQDPR